jgi:PEP-CTERM motif
MKKCISLSTLVLAIAPFGAAHSFLIDRDNSSGAVCSAANPCGTVTVTGTSTLTVSISMNAGFAVFGNNDTFGFSTVGSDTGVSISNFSSALFNGNGGSGNEAGWGSFEFRVDGPGGSSAVQNLSFDIIRPADPFTSPADIEAGASGGNGSTLFGLHVRNNTSGLGGFAGVDASLPEVTPEPASLGLIGLAGVSLGLFRRRRNARLKQS